MLVAYPFNPKDESQALKNAQWITELPNKGKHKFLIVHDFNSNPNQIKDILAKSFDVAGILPVKDHWNKWCESANQMWCETARYIEYTLKEPWLWLEPDAIPIKESWLDKLEAEYKRGNRPFMGGLVPKFHDSPDHMTGVGIYPGELIKYAGVMLMSAGEPVPFDLMAAAQVASQSHFTDLIQHRWSRPENPNPPFTSVEDMKQRMTSECVLYHSDKSGSIIDVLRKEGDASLNHPVLTTSNGESKVQSSDSPVSSDNNQSRVDEKNGELNEHLQAVARNFISPLAKARLMKKLKSYPIIK